MPVLYACTLQAVSQKVQLEILLEIPSEVQVKAHHVPQKEYV